MSGLKSITFFYIVTTLRMFRNSFFDKVAKKLVNGTWVVLLILDAVCVVVKRIDADDTRANAVQQRFAMRNNQHAHAVFLGVIKQQVPNVRLRDCVKHR